MSLHHISFCVMRHRNNKFAEPTITVGFQRPCWPIDVLMRYCGEDAEYKIVRLFRNVGACILVSAKYLRNYTFLEEPSEHANEKTRHCVVFYTYVQFHSTGIGIRK